MIKPFHWLLLAIFFVVFIWSGIAPFDRFTWVLEVSPAAIALLVVAATYHRFRLSDLAYMLILLHCIVLLVGGKYTYALVPLFSDIRDWLGAARNSYDGVGHFAQGFVPAIIARELLLRTSPLKPGKWLVAIILLSCLGISALYELLEAGVALAAGAESEAFLGTQGDVWDTQKDMLLALIGAAAALIILSKWHDHSLRKFYKDRDATV